MPVVKPIFGRGPSEDVSVSRPELLTNAKLNQISDYAEYLASLRFENAGTWAADVAYAYNAIVTHEDADYKALAPSTGVVPGTDATKWKLWGGGVPNGGITTAKLADAAVTYNKLDSGVTSKFDERPTSVEVDTKISDALDDYDGGDNIVAGDNVTITEELDGSKRVSATGDLTGVFASQTVQVTTAELEPGESETFTITLGRYAKLARLQTDAPAWVRLYPSVAAQSADALRPQDDYFEGDQLIFDYLSVDGPISALLEAVDAYSMESPRIGTYPLVVQNSSLENAAITVTLHYVTLEI